MKRFKEGSICPYKINMPTVGCFCEFCDYMRGITADNDVDCIFEDMRDEETTED